MICSNRIHWPQAILFCFNMQWPQARVASVLSRSEWPHACLGCSTGPKEYVSCFAGSWIPSILATKRADRLTVFICGCLAWHREIIAPDLTKKYLEITAQDNIYWVPELGCNADLSMGQPCWPHMHIEQKKKSWQQREKNKANVERKVEKRHDNGKRERLQSCRWLSSSNPSHN